MIDFDTAKKQYREACDAVESACLAELRRLVQKVAPAATGLGLTGYWDNDGNLNISIDAVHGAALSDEEFEQMQDDAVPLLDWLGTVGGDNYHGADDIDFV